MDPSMGVSVDEHEVQGTSVTTIRWEPPDAEGAQMFGMPATLAVQYAVTDDRVLVGVGDDFVTRALGLDSADSLAAAQRFSSAVDEMGGAESASLTWLDLAGTYAAVEEAVGPEMLGEMEAWIAPLDQLISVTRRDGDLLIQRAALLVD